MRSPLLALFAVALAGCVADTESDQQLSENGGNGDGEECECVKIEGADIGVDGTIVHVDGETIVFESWTPKVDSPGEFVGFTLSANAAGLTYTVKAGTETFEGSGTSWSHPAGDSGPDAHGISNVDLCPPDGGENPPEELPDVD